MCEHYLWQQIQQYHIERNTDTASHHSRLVVIKRLNAGKLLAVSVTCVKREIRQKSFTIHLCYCILQILHSHRYGPILKRQSITNSR